MATATSTQLRFLTDAAHLLRQSAPETSAHLMRRRIDIALNSQAQAAATAASTGSTGPLSSSTSAPIAALPQNDIQRQHVCTSCGLILIPGSDGTTLTIQSGLPSQKKEKKKLDRKRKRNDKTETTSVEPDKKPRVQTPHAGITKVYKCGFCSKETRISLPAPLPLAKHRNKKAMPTALPKIEETEPTPAATQNLVTSSKPQTPSSTAPPPKAASNANSKKRAKNRKAGLLALLDKSRGSDSGSLNLNLSFDDFRKK
ncbi:hypothetical protein Sste5346_004406 [Sporothrix stenoceras]|uniref:Uncharacterized protein n=1 Tax=Sporothrix stenoceras TaxID=5173 RepID=A0ABR3ZA92_9PEZI